MKKKEEGFLMYKGKPFVRCGNTLYYGDMNDKYVAMLQIQEKEQIQDVEIATRVTIQIINTDPEARPRERIIKRGEKNGLYEAMDVGSIWLDRALRDA